MKTLSFSLVAGGLALAAVSPAVAQHDHHDDEGSPRLVVSDGSRGRLTVADLGTGKSLARIPLPSKDGAYLTPAADGRHVVAVQYDGGHVRVLDAGIWQESHGDHSHQRLASPKLTPFRMDAKHPTHVVFHGGTAALFVDSTGNASLYKAGDLAKAATPIGTVSGGLPHHGVTVPFGPLTLTTTATADPKESEPLANDVIVKRGDTEISRLGSCPDLHGEASGKGWVAYACGDGVMLASVTDTGATARKIPYPAGATKDQRIWGFGHDGDGRFLLGDYDAGLVVFDRTAGTMKPIDLPVRRSVYKSPLVGSQAYTLTEDGKVHRINVATGKIVASAKVVAPYDWRKSKGPTPELAASHDFLTVSEPKKGRVHVLHPRTLKVQRVITLGGAPTKMFIADGMPEDH